MPSHCFASRFPFFPPLLRSLTALGCSVLRFSAVILSMIDVYCYDWAPIPQAPLSPRTHMGSVASHALACGRDDLRCDALLFDVILSAATRRVYCMCVRCAIADSSASCTPDILYMRTYTPMHQLQNPSGSDTAGGRTRSSSTVAVHAPWTVCTVRTARAGWAVRRRWVREVPSSLRPMIPSR